MVLVVDGPGVSAHVGDGGGVEVAEEDSAADADGHGAREGFEGGDGGGDEGGEHAGEDVGVEGVVPAVEVAVHEDDFGLGP